MTNPVKTINGSQLLIQIGDGASPEVFAHDCLINTERGIAFGVDVSESLRQDCDDLTAPSWKDREKDGLSGDITGAGQIHTPSIEAWFNWMKGADAKNCRVMINVAGALGGGYWAGAFHLTKFEITGPGKKEKCTVSVTLQSTGELTWTDNA